MSVTVRIPAVVRHGLREKLWSMADELDWARLDWYEKSAKYEVWTRDQEIGGLLANYMDQRQIRVYLKDTIMKGYVRSRQADSTLPFAALGIDRDAAVMAIQERPHGRRLQDGRFVAWGSSEDWKLVLTALHERTWRIPGARAYGVVLMAATGKYGEPSVRAMVEDAARKLAIARLVWLD